MEAPKKIEISEDFIYNLDICKSNVKDLIDSLISSRISSYSKLLS